MKEDSKYGIWGHERLNETLDMKDLFQRLHGLVWKQTLGLYKKIGHLLLPARIDFKPSHSEAGAFKIRRFEISDEQPI